jgi:uncharacterized protein YndB with AHSA1/START domain
MTYEFKLSCVLPAPPAAVYDAWLTSAGHSNMTGSAAKMSKRVGAEVSAWDGYIFGKNLELEPGRRIVQSWRTTEFGEGDANSTIIVTLSPIKAGCRLSLRHSGVPDSQTGYEKGGWDSHYFDPMKAYFGKAKSKPVVNAYRGRHERHAP